MPRDVTDGPQPFTGSHTRIDVDAVLVVLDSDRVQPDVRDAGTPPRGHQQPVAPQLTAIAQLHHVVLAIAPGGRDRDPDQHLDAVAAQDLGHGRTEARRLPSEQAVGHLDERHLTAETAYDLGQFDAGGAAPQHEETPGNGLHARRLPGPPEALELTQAGNGWHERVGTICHDDVLGGVPRAVDLHRADAGQPAVTPDQVDAPVG